MTVREWFRAWRCEERRALHRLNCQPRNQGWPVADFERLAYLGHPARLAFLERKAVAALVASGRMKREGKSRATRYRRA